MGNYMDYKIYVVSLQNEIKRREIITSRLKSLRLDYEFVNAVDLRNKSHRDLEDIKQGYEIKSLRDITPGELVCSLSHKEVYKRIIKDDVKCGIVLEDDAILTSGFEKHIIDIMKLNISDDIVILGYSKLSESDQYLFYKKEPIKVKHRVSTCNLGKVWKDWSCGTVGYLITKEGVKKMISKNILSIADDWSMHKNNCDITILHCRPCIVFEDFVNIPSSIECERKDYMKKNNVVKDIARVIRGIIRHIMMFFMR